MDRARDYDSKNEACRSATNFGFEITSSVDELNIYAINRQTGSILYSLEQNEEGLFYWETY